MRSSRGVVLLAALAALGGASCKTKSASPGEETVSGPGRLDKGHDVPTPVFDKSEPPPAERKPVQGADLGSLSASDKQRFERLVDKLPSPCGKPHSLRTSRNTDAECLRAKFAVDYLIALLGDGATDEEVSELYDQRYRKQEPKQSFHLADDVPHVGPTDARVVMVEFFDFGCPACQHFFPELEQVPAAYPNDVVVYFKQFPLAVHGPDSVTAAQGAVAAGKQGKYHEMHKLLFENPDNHKKGDIDKFAHQLGLDMARFQTDFDAAAAQVASDQQEGNKASVDSTPSLFVNGRRYEDPQLIKYLKLWIDEELALNR
jgi:protein-disulfide isomerase